MTTHRTLIWAGLSLAALAGSAMAKPSIPMDYCANSNTAETDASRSNYQSDGLCFNHCHGLNFALAIVQGKNCWCSNLVPNKDNQRPLSDCQNPCPGYPSDFCGGDDTYGYMLVDDASPTGTAPPAVETSSHSSITSGGATTATTSNVQTVTVGGTVLTVTATPTSSGVGSQPIISSGSKGLSGGAIAGIVVGVVGGVCLLLAMGWLLFAKRRRNRLSSDEKFGFGTSTGGTGAGSPGRLATPHTGDFSGASSAHGWTDSHRRSRMMAVDPRLDPFAKGIYMGDPNGSRESFGSLQDNHDYSRRVAQPPRVLRATNPDPIEDDDD